MEYSRRQTIALNDKNLSSFLEVNSWGDDVFVLEGRQYSLGMCMVCSPLSDKSFDVSTLSDSGLLQLLPKNCFLQVQQLWTSTINNAINKHLSSKMHVNSLPENSILKRALLSLQQQLRDFRLAPHNKGNNVRLRESVTIVSVKYAVGSLPDQSILGNAKSIFTEIQSYFSKTGMNCTRLNGEEYTALVHSLLLMGFTPDVRYDKEYSIKSQLIPEDLVFDVSKNMLTIRKKELFTRVCSMSLQTGPSIPSDSITLDNLVGDFYGGENQVTLPFLMSWTITNSVSSKKKNISPIEKQRETIQGVLDRWAYFISDREECSLEFGKPDKGSEFKGWFNISFFDQDPESLKQCAEKIRKRFYQYGLDMFEDIFFTGTSFLNQLPLCTDQGAVDANYRFLNVQEDQVTSFLPIISDWPGSGEGSKLLFATRRGHIVLYDVFDNHQNPNLVISGKDTTDISRIGFSIISSYMLSDVPVTLVTDDEIFPAANLLMPNEVSKIHGSGISFNPLAGVLDSHSLKEAMWLLEFLVSAIDGVTRRSLLSLYDEFYVQDDTTKDFNSFVQFVCDCETENTDDIKSLLTVLGNIESISPVQLSDSDLCVVEVNSSNVNACKSQIYHCCLNFLERCRVENGRNRILYIDLKAEILSDEIVGRIIAHVCTVAPKYGGAVILCMNNIVTFSQCKLGAFVSSTFENSVTCSLSNADQNVITGWRCMKVHNISPQFLKGSSSCADFCDAIVTSNSGWAACRHVDSRWHNLMCSTTDEEIYKSICQLINLGVSPEDIVDHLVLDKDISKVLSGIRAKSKHGKSEMSDQLLAQVT